MASPSDSPRPQGQPSGKALSKERLREGAVETLINSVSILSEVIDDFRSSDRFFKYKALVLATWAFLSVSSVAVACTGHGPANDIGAALIVGGDSSRTIYMIKNEGLAPWKDVEIIVNGGYRSTLSQVEANGGSVTLSPAVLFDGQGNKAPAKLSITDIELRTTEPEGKANLLVGGVQQK